MRESGNFQDDVVRHARSSLGQVPEELSNGEWFRAVALAARDRLLAGRLATESRYRAQRRKRVYYLSMEFLVGRLLEESLINLGLLDDARRALDRLGADFDAVLRAEPDAALGNGGLGRLAACFLESMATLGIAGFGYGILYEFGIFRQAIVDGAQRERPDQWLRFGSPWLVERPDESCLVPLYGRVEGGQDAQGAYNPLWLDWRLLVGVPHDLPVAGFGGRTVNSLRLFSARASDQFDMEVFNEGDYLRAVEGKIAAETVSKVLYPSDSFEAGRELRLVQEIFLVCCALRDALRRDLAGGGVPATLAERVAIQLNDTHPAFAVVELMRLLVDEREEPWERAWSTTQAVFAYTNHTLMAEALERWPVALVERVAPRHLEILYEINRRFLADVAARWPGDTGRLARMSIVEEVPARQVRMANLAIVGSHSVNGVARLHSQLVRDELVPDFAAFWPERFNNKTNGVSLRRWLLVANPALSELITEAIGEAWITDAAELRNLAPFADDAAFLERAQLVKAANKRRLATFLATAPGPRLDQERLLDVQVKRIHEYKRQLLNVLSVLDDYLAFVEEGVPPPAPRSVLIAGKAAPGYALAKQIIRLAHAVAALLTRDPRARPWLELVFVADYRVTLAETIIPAGELSQQISTAGTEASGTSNMKFAFNGALTIGTLDGATVEMSEALGAENLFLFGLRSEEVAALRRAGDYRPRELYRQDPGIRRTLDALAGPALAGGEFAWLRDRLLDNDPYFLLADWAAYRAARRHAGVAWLDQRSWTRTAVLGIANMGYFSSDRAIAEYAGEIWDVAP